MIHELTLPITIRYKNIFFILEIFKEFPLDMIWAQIYQTFFSFLVSEQLVGQYLLLNQKSKFGNQVISKIPDQNFLFEQSSSEVSA